MYKHIIFLTLIILGACSQSDPTERLNTLSKRSIELKEIEIENYIRRVDDLIFDKFNVKEKLLVVDSITDAAFDELDKSQTREEVKDLFNRWKSSVTQVIEINPYTEDINTLTAPNYFKSNVRFEIAYASRELINDLSDLIGAQEIKFDKVESFIIPEKESVNIGEQYKAKIYLAAYSSNIEEILEIRCNGKPINIKNGVGYIEFTPTEKGTFTYRIEFEGSKNKEFLKPYQLKKEIKYTVK